MKPTLVAMAGPLKGRQFDLTEEPIIIGREPSNRCSVDDPAVSRQHCSIEKKGDEFLITDLNSLNGTFVNNVPVLKRVLKHRDQIDVGDCHLVCLFELEKDVEVSQEVEFREDESELEATVQLESKDAFYLQAGKSAVQVEPNDRVIQDLDVLLRISTTISPIRERQTFDNRLMELIFEVVPAERGVIFLFDETSEEPVSIFSREKIQGIAESFRVSRTVVHEVTQRKVGIISNDIGQDKLLNAADSLASAHIHSLLAVPIISQEKAIGVIYLDSIARGGSFDEHHLQLMTGIAGIAGLVLDNIAHVESLRSENLRLQEDLTIEHNMVGESGPMQSVYRFIGKVGPVDSTVLISGESGTGKELVARAIHRNSPRVDKPFIAINCAALTETLLESELFGHEKGAFTGAIALKKGKLEVASSGTLFLDEIGELAVPLQAKLLRVLQQREFDRVGGTRPIRVDIRLVAATNRDLVEAVRKGDFREDLYFRLNVVSVKMPALRDRREDIPLLASYFVAKLARNFKRRVTGISAKARQCLSNYDWPGNIRELENALERAVVLGLSELILPEDLPESLFETESTASGTATKYHDAIREKKRQLIVNAVGESRGSYTQAAKKLGLHPNYLHRLIRNLDLKSTLMKLPEK